MRGWGNGNRLISRPISATITAAAIRSTTPDFIHALDRLGEKQHHLLDLHLERGNVGVDAGEHALQ
ncbi:hypothetical protein ACFXG4_48725 [Nocardia sp. NPDC059246]|uniref:hypothetical protein n=1 Tax=unclassified Nocardia TaxID=2637762 RepID=UPI00368D6AD9